MKTCNFHAEECYKQQVDCSVIDNTLKIENEYALVRLSGQSTDCRESLIGAHSQCVASR